MLFSWHRDVIIGDAFLRPKAGLFHINIGSGLRIEADEVAENSLPVEFADCLMRVGDRHLMRVGDRQASV